MVVGRLFNALFEGHDMVIAIINSHVTFNDIILGGGGERCGECEVPGTGSCRSNSRHRLTCGLPRSH